MIQYYVHPIWINNENVHIVSSSLVIWSIYILQEMDDSASLMRFSFQMLFKMLLLL